MPVAATLLDIRQRETVTEAIHETCRIRDWFVSAVNVRTNHVHVVVSAPDWAPERVLTVLKAFATRSLREEELIPADARVWARHGSTRYLWSEEDVLAAAQYVLEGQDMAKPRR